MSNETVYKNGNNYSFDKNKDVSLIRDLEPFGNPSEATAALMEGLKATIDKIQKRIQVLAAEPSFKLNEYDWTITLLDLILVKKAPDGNDVLYFPVEMKKIIKIIKDRLNGALDKSFLITIDIDNPTVLGGNIPQGPLGSHFGYDIAQLFGSGETETGHVWMKIFPGFPTRTRSAAHIEAVKEEISRSKTKCINPKYLIGKAIRKEKLPFDITTENGVSSVKNGITTFKGNSVESLQRLHVVFEDKSFSLPNFLGHVGSIGNIFYMNDGGTYVPDEIKVCFHAGVQHDPSTCFGGIESSLSRAKINEIFGIKN